MSEWPTTGSASIVIASTPQAAYDYVTDLEKLPTLSPENQRCEFLDDNTSIKVGGHVSGAGTGPATTNGTPTAWY